MNQLRYYDLGYSEVFIFEHYLVNQIKGGQVVVHKHVEVLKKMITRHFFDRELMYISNRVNSYSVDPLIYREIAKIENLIGLAIVVDTDMKMKTAMYEKQFYSKPYEVFYTMNDAIIWTASQLKDLE
ncbi:hypothetical protein LX97_00599 [Nonlabens dokdonensis]|jgi:hypothetical protein|uniref:Uncharacterized protein n=2 Tax=Nonlabens dokdonensis TaxID=328515 RepID=L7WAK7_NONDD|nr:hypothetical protein [Nonlabens dokdonensis]AGC75918.1 hypothetical protein DDD_0791 [Nonlabens dokdonensis DSW-6]PZX43598.1 hypothetical protein LX97_00599 [Nonlabens dokdonensis]